MLAETSNVESKDIENNLPDAKPQIEDPDVLDELKKSNLPEETKSFLIERERLTTFSGPLPDPDSFAKYESILPGSAERILKMAENEQNTRHELNFYQAKMESRDGFAGIIVAAGLGIAGLVAGVLVAVLVPGVAGASVGAIFGVRGVGSIAMSVLNGTRHSK